MKLVPTRGRCVVRRNEIQTKTKGGLYLPDAAKEAPLRGVVLAVGEPEQLKDGSERCVELSEGDEIAFTGYAGLEIDLEGEKFLILEQIDVLAIVSKE